MYALDIYTALAHFVSTDLSVSLVTHTQETLCYELCCYGRSFASNLSHCVGLPSVHVHSPNSRSWYLAGSTIVSYIGRLFDVEHFMSTYPVPTDVVLGLVEHNVIPCDIKLLDLLVYKVDLLNEMIHKHTTLLDFSHHYAYVKNKSVLLIIPRLENLAPLVALAVIKQLVVHRRNTAETLRDELQAQNDPTNKWMLEATKTFLHHY